MTKDGVLQLRFLGVIPQLGYLEYGFRVEDKDKNTRLVVLMIESGFFAQNNLMFQEAPDLCYQKVLMELNSETSDARISGRVPVTASDIARYRELHPNTKSRKSARRDTKQL